MPLKRRIKVLGFDGWTLGFRHFCRLREAFVEAGIEFLLIHLGSWGDEPGRPKDEWIEGLRVRDISFYEGCDFDDILSLEAPDAVLLLSTETFLHRAMLRYCAARRIPTIHLFHGVIGVVPVSAATQTYTVDGFGHLRYSVERSIKFLRRTALTYAAALGRTNASTAEWRRFGLDVSERARGREISIPARDSRTDVCCVYTPADLEVAETKWQYGGEGLFVVGNPDLTMLGLAESDLGSWRPTSTSTRPRIVYIDSGISSHGWNFSSDAAYGRYLLECSNSLKLQGIDLVVKLKPHPPARYQQLARMLESHGVDLVENSSLKDELRSSAGCIVEPSTLSIVPCLVGCPVFLCKVGPLSTLVYGELFNSYPHATDLFRWQDISRGGLAREADDDHGQLRTWIDRNSGPMPPERMPYRVAEAISTFVR